MDYYFNSLNTIFQNINSSKNGLSSDSIQKQQSLFGTNQLEYKKSSNFLTKFFLQFKNIMIVILLVSAVISTTLAIIENDYENLAEGVLIFVIVIINAIVGVIQEQKAEHALSTLNKASEPFALVLRDGKKQKIKTSDIVVGDIVFLKTGNRVPADIRLIDSLNLKCDESSLTGESESVPKDATLTPSKNATLAELHNFCFSGTSVTAGTAKGVVVAVGKNTEFGKIAKNITADIKEKTPLEKNIDKIGKIITYGVLAIVVIVFLCQLLFSKNIQTIDALLTAVALAVAAIPESLPAVITLIMAMGVQKLARHNAIIKKLSAVETLGSCNIICTDKTGTLTKNDMVVNHIFTPFQMNDCNHFDFSRHTPLTLASVLCLSASINQDGKILGDATESAIIKLLQSKNINLNSIKSQHTKISENEFSSSRKMMSVVCLHGSQKTLYAKGAIDYLLPKCSMVVIDDQIVPLTHQARQKILVENTNICKLGERVIAFAYKETTDSTDENDMVFCGFFGIVDPPRKESFNAIKTCKSAGLKTIMITGDHPETAFAIAKQLKIANHKNQVISGSELNNLSSQNLKAVINNYTVFARVTPEHKLKIIKALKENGNIVAMTGDGINDAPSIKNAHIGVCMGQTGTDVTKEVSDIIVTDDNFSTIVLAIKQGRTIYHNITKTIIFLLSTNLVEVLGLFATSIIFPGTVFLSASQILFINLVSDSLPAFALGVEPSEKNIMTKPPLDTHKSLLSGNNGWTILYQGFAQTMIVLIVFVVCLHKFGADTANTITFLTICIMQLVHAINCKTEDSIFKINIFNNRFFNISFAFLLALTLALYFIPALSQIFSLTKLTLAMWLVVVPTSLSIIPVAELGKLFINKQQKKKT